MKNIFKSEKYIFKYIEPELLTYTQDKMTAIVEALILMRRNNTIIKLKGIKK